MVGEGSVLSMGVFIGASTKIVDRATGEMHYGKVPPYSVVVSGALPGKPLPDGEPGPSLYCAVIVKRVDEQTRSKTSINELLRRLSEHCGPPADRSRRPAQALIRRPSVTPADAGALDALAARCSRSASPAGACPSRRRGRRGSTTSTPALRQAAGPAFLLRRPYRRGAGRPARGLERRSFAAEITDGRLYGRGAADMKGAIAAFAAAAARFVAKRGGDFAGAISLLITGDEEGPSVNGTKPLLQALAAEGENFDACLVGEPTNPERVGDMVKIGRRGSLTGHLTVKGVQGHIAYPHLADNPTHRLVRMIVALTETPLDDGTAHFEPSTLQVTTIDVGNPATNVIPAEARASFNIRFNDGFNPATLEAEVRRRLEQVGGALRAAHRMLGRVLPDAARPAQRPGHGGGRGRDRPDAGAFDHRRHLGRALHQGLLPGDRVRPGRRHHAQGGRERRNRGYSPAFGHLRTHS